MSMSLGRRRGLEGNADAPCRWNTPVDAHIGGPREYHARVLRAAREAALGLRREEFLDKLELRATDERLLKWSWDFLSSHGGQAPGVDGMRYADVADTIVWAEMRRLRDEIRNDEFVPEELRE